nr:DsbA family protein [uncultured Acetatifactor sp.]
MEALDILFVTDYVCPYCLVAKVALEEALRETGMEAVIRIQPMELTPEPRERVDTCHDEVRKKHYQILVEPAKALGLDMKLPPAICPRPYTRLAFEGMFYAREKGLDEKYSDLVYRAYFEQEQDIGEMDVLCDIAEKAGLDREEFRRALTEGIYTEQVKKESAYSREELKVGGVPTIYINGASVSVEKYTKEEMAEILKEGQVSTGGGFACGIDGCG